MKHHDLNIHPIPEDQDPLFIDEPELIDKSILNNEFVSTDPNDYEDNVRVYIPMDINRESILRRLDTVIYSYGEANEKNELDFSIDVDELIAQVEIYDQVWCARHTPEKGKHSAEAVALVKEFVSKLEQIPDGCAEIFPFETIDELREEYLGITPEDFRNPSVFMNQVIEDRDWSSITLKLHLELVGGFCYGAREDLDMYPDEKVELLSLAKAQKGISRDIIVAGDMNLHALHFAIQRLFGWRNSHLHNFSLSKDDFDRVTDNLFGKYCDLCGVLFRFPDDDFSDLYWDDDYKEGTSIKSWYKKKYTRPFKNGSVGDSWLGNVWKVDDFCNRFPEFTDDQALDEVTDSVVFEQDLNTLTECLPVGELLLPKYIERLDLNEWRDKIYTQIEENISMLEKDPGAQARMHAFSDNLKDCRARMEWLDNVKWQYPDNYKSRVRKSLGKSYDDAVAEMQQMIPYWTEHCNELFYDWSVEPAPLFSDIYYQYDYGDDWCIKISVEDVYYTADEGTFLRPKCIASDGLKLVDDCRGPNGYLDMLRTIHGSDKEAAKEMRAWAKSQGWSNSIERTENML